MSSTAKLRTKVDGLVIEVQELDEVADGLHKAVYAAIEQLEQADPLAALDALYTIVGEPSPPNPPTHYDSLYK